MPSEQEHARQALHNKEFLGSFGRDSTPHLDWMVTVIFYTALHIVEQYLAHKGLHPADHTTRDAYLWRARGLKPIWLDYRCLKDESMRARYEVASFTADEIQGHQERLARIETHVRLLLDTADKGRGVAVHEPGTDYETGLLEPPPGAQICTIQSCDPKLLVGLSDAELEVLADSVLAPRLQERLDHLLQLNRECVLDNDTKQKLDRLLEQVDQMNVLKARAMYTLRRRQKVVKG